MSRMSRMSGMSGNGFRAKGVRAFLLSLVLFVSAQMYGVGFIPTDAGMVLNFETGD